MNGGNAPGKDKFYTETGIKKSDWFGKHWVRWGDALLEAGFTPNKLQGAYEEEALILNVVSLTRGLGRFPVGGDLRMKARIDSNFPSHTVFHRLGLKNQLVQRVMEYCQTHEGFQDVLALCPAAVDREELAETSEAGQEIGFVYLIKSGRYYKIDRSNSAGRREYELALQLPEKATKVHEIRTDDPIGIEAYWHNRFASKRKNGEWFDLNASDVQAFRRRKFM